MKLAKVSFAVILVARAAPEDGEQASVIPVIDPAETAPAFVLDEELETTTPEPYLAGTSTDEFDVIGELNSDGALFTDTDLTGAGLDYGDEFSDDSEESGTLPAFVMNMETTTAPVLATTTTTVAPSTTLVLTAAVTIDEVMQTPVALQTEAITLENTKAFQSADVPPSIGVVLPLAATAMFFI